MQRGDPQSQPERLGAVSVSCPSPEMAVAVPRSPGWCCGTATAMEPCVLPLPAAPRRAAAHRHLHIDPYVHI